MTILRRALLLAAALLLVPASAVGDDPFVPTATDDPDLVAAAQAWRLKGIDDYTTRVKLRCFCLLTPAVRTVVRNGEISKVVQDGRRLSLRKGYSMDALFEMIREAHAAADSVEVTYTSRGVPKSIMIDRDTMMADEESYYGVSVVLP